MLRYLLSVSPNGLLRRLGALGKVAPLHFVTGVNYMNFKKLVTAALIAMAGVAAHATVVTSTSGNTTTYSENFNGGTSFSAGAFDAPLTSDDYLWLTQPGTNAASYTFAAASAVQSLTVSFWYSALSTAAQWSLSGPVSALGNTGGLLAVTFNNPGAGGSSADQWVSQTWNNLSAGNYTLAFSTGLGQLKVDDVAISVTAVPEPGTYAMMLAGLGLIGTVARRRKAKQA